MTCLRAVAKLAAASACLMLLGACAMLGRHTTACICPPTAAVASTMSVPSCGGVTTTSKAATTQVASAAPAPAPPTMTPSPKPARAGAVAPAPELSGAPGRIYFYRASIIGTVLQPDVLLNGKAVGKIVPKAYFYVDRPPGTYQVSSTMKDTRSLTFTLQPGQTAYVEVNVIPGIVGGRIIPLLVDENEAKDTLKRRPLTAP